VGAVKTGAKFCSRVRKESVISMGRLPCVGVLRPRQVAKKSRGSRPVFLLSHSPSKVRNKNSEMVKDRLAGRQARAAITLLRMGKAGEIIPLLQHSADPRLRSFIVNWLNPLGADPKILAAELDLLPATNKPPTAEGQQFMDAVLFHPETSQRRALILALGTYGTGGLSPGEREPLVGKLLDLFRNDSDSGIHGAAEWTLRQWGQQDKLKEVAAQLMKLKDRGEHRWYV